jgi:hypothetical protein
LIWVKAVLRYALAGFTPFEQELSDDGTWLGRGDGTIDEWDSLRQEAARLQNDRTAAYLLAKPMLADHLQEGLSQFGCSCEDF